MPNPRITSSHLITYAKKKGITIAKACEIFDKIYEPCINHWTIRK